MLGAAVGFTEGWRVLIEGESVGAWLGAGVGAAVWTQLAAACAEKSRL